MSEERILDKIQKLLAKAESTNSTHEAEALFAKAQQLMVQHAIDEARLVAGGRQQFMDPVKVVATIKNPFLMPKMTLLNEVGKVNNCKVIVLDQRKGTCAIIGMPDDVEFVQMLFTSLLIQLAGDLKRAVPTGDTREYRKGLVNGFVGIVGKRMREQSRLRREAEDDATGGDQSSSVALAIRDRKSLVEDAVSHVYPDLRPIRSKASLGSYAGRMAGQEAGSRADISGGRNRAGSGTRGALGS